jgi:hypothetical protein
MGDLDVDTVDDTMDDMKELLAKQEEIATALSGKSLQGDEDEEQLETELELILNESTGKREQGEHGRIARGGHRLLTVTLGPSMCYPSMPCGRATPETTLQPFQEWPAQRAGGLRPSYTLLDTPPRTPMKVKQP